MPHLKTLVERHENDPFALIGINTGDEPDAYHEGVKEFGLTWLSAFQGQAMTPISDLYKVRGYPTYLVLDTDGTIAYRGHSGTEIDAVVADLLAKAKAKDK
jgi:hypothetical protein